MFFLYHITKPTAVQDFLPAQAKIPTGEASSVGITVIRSAYTSSGQKAGISSSLN